LTSSSPSRAENSFCKTAMSRREANVSRVDVTIMDRSAHSEGLKAGASSGEIE
jgi:hypothetical protein